jgi:hypothetical protein
VERGVGAVQEGHPPVIGAETERHRPLVAWQRVLHDLLDRHAAAFGALRAAGHRSVREGHPCPQARPLAAVLIRPLHPRRVDRSHRPRDSRRGPSWGPCSRWKPKKDAIFPAGTGEDGIFRRKVDGGRVPGGAGSCRSCGGGGGGDQRLPLWDGDGWVCLGFGNWLVLGGICKFVTIIYFLGVFPPWIVFLMHWVWLIYIYFLYK